MDIIGLTCEMVRCLAERFFFAGKRESAERVKPQHPPLNLGSNEIARKTEHLGMILDEKLNFKSHIKEAIIKARKGIGMIEFCRSMFHVKY